MGCGVWVCGVRCVSLSVWVRGCGCGRGRERGRVGVGVGAGVGVGMCVDDFLFVFFF